MPQNLYSIGVDFGTNSVRALIVNVRDGSEVASSVYDYRRGEAGIILDPSNPHVARQHPADYHEGVVACISNAFDQARQVAGVAPEQVIGIGVDTTGSTPIPVNRDGTPLALLAEFADNINALAWLWKDHSSMSEAEQITAIGSEHRPQYLAKSGGAYSSEWFFSKIWHCLNVAPEVFDAAWSWVEFCDYIPALLAGDTRPEHIKRSVCAAGHKAMYSAPWGGLPDAEFLARLDPRLADLRARLYDQAYPSNVAAGTLCAHWATRLGLPEGIPIAVGGLDAHYGAVASGVAPGSLVKIIGTSSCDITVAPQGAEGADIPGVCGVVMGSVLPGYEGIEAGQSAVGDLLNWFVTYVCEGDASTHDALTAEAALLRPGQSGLLALDWNNGNRTVLVDARLTGLLLGQTLATTRAEMYRALIEATAFGGLTIQNRMQECGVPINRVIACGGIAEKNPMFMQIYADVTGATIQLSRSSQTCALGAAIFGAVVAGSAAGGYDSAEEAQAAIVGYKDITQAATTAATPIPKNHAVYVELYALYRRLHDSFGVQGHCDCLYDVMKKLLDIKQRVTEQQ